MLNLEPGSVVRGEQRLKSLVSQDELPPSAPVSDDLASVPLQKHRRNSLDASSSDACSTDFDSADVGSSSSGVDDPQRLTTPMSHDDEETHAIDRSSLLHFRHACSQQHKALPACGAEVGLKAVAYPILLCGNRAAQASSHSKKIKDAGAHAKRLTPSETGYKILKASTREAEIRRTTMALLNKVCPENKTNILKQLSEIHVEVLEELEIVAKALFSKAVEEPHYAETYAQVASALSLGYPTFAIGKASERQCNFRRLVIRECQVAFEDLPVSLNDFGANSSFEEAEDQQRRLKKRALANMWFVGHLFLCEQLSLAVVSKVLQQSLGKADDLRVECACELLKVVGAAMCKRDQGRDLLEKYLARLSSLKAGAGQAEAGGLSKRVGFVIQDVVDMCSNGWTQRLVICEKATTKQQLRQSAATPPKIAAP
jgi:translation initiation factor 4G